MIYICKNLDDFDMLKNFLEKDFRSHSEANFIHVFNDEDLNLFKDAPCIVEYNFKDDPNGPYYYEYEFHPINDFSLVLMEDLESIKDSCKYYS